MQPVRLEFIHLAEWQDWIRLPLRLRDALENISAPQPFEFYEPGEFWITLAINNHGNTVAAQLYTFAGRTIWARSTWTRKDWRGRGLAGQLWHAGIELQAATRVRVITCSNGGHGLIQKLKRELAGRVQFMISDVRDSVDRDRADRQAKRLSYAA